LMVTVAVSSVMDEYEYEFATTSYDEVITVNELRLIYKGKITRWTDGSKIRLFVRPFGDYGQKSMAREILGVSYTTFNEYMNKNKKAKVVSASRMFDTVSKNSGSIGLVDDEYCIVVDNGVVRKLKVVE
jgi:ABC-type phosphate transport system substrate-binding protein